MFTVVTVLLPQCPDGYVVDEPRQALRLPVDAVLVELCRHLELRSYRSRPVIAASNSLAEVVCLHIGIFLPVVITGPLPVDLVGGIRHQHGRRDEACPGSGLHYYIGTAIKEVSGSPDIRCIVTLFDWENTAILFVGAKSRIISNCPAVLRNVFSGKFGEVSADG